MDPGWFATGHYECRQGRRRLSRVLQEYGFTDSETATYTRDDGRKLTIKAARFKDATGAYGAFTFYRQQPMKIEEIGTKAASANDRILFFRSNVLVDANFDRVTEMSARRAARTRRDAACRRPDRRAICRRFRNICRRRMQSPIPRATFWGRRR